LLQGTVPTLGMALYRISAHKLFVANKEFDAVAVGRDRHRNFREDTRMLIRRFNTGWFAFFLAEKTFSRRPAGSRGSFLIF